MPPESLELPIEHTCNSNAHVPSVHRVTEIVLDELVQVICVVEATFVEETVNHPPTPVFDYFCVFFSQSVPKVLQFAWDLLLVTDLILGVYVSIQGS